MLTAVGAVGVFLAGCGGGDGDGASPAATTGATEAASTTADPAASDGQGEFGVPEQVRATANLFAAGRDELPQPGRGGGGGFPPVWELPEDRRAITFSSVTGEVNPIATQVGVEYNGPEGDGRGPTNINSYDGIAGMVHGRNGMFLAGVFLGDEPPRDPSPPRLDFTRNEDFGELAPKIGQTFFVGDGRGRTYEVPEGATRLFLGFVDAASFEGDPGYYNNNAGELTVVVEVAGQ